MTNDNDTMAAVEALLFINGDPLSIDTLVHLLDVPVIEVTQTLHTLREHYENNSSRGLRVLLYDNTAQLVTHPRVSAVVEALRESSIQETLTPAALETLAVVAYRGPLPKTEIESIRGVNCSSILRTLLLRGLIERERDANDGRIVLYRITTQLLQALGIVSLDELPDIP